MFRPSTRGKEPLDVICERRTQSRNGARSEAWKAAQTDARTMPRFGIRILHRFFATKIVVQSLQEVRMRTIFPTDAKRVALIKLRIRFSKGQLACCIDGFFNRWPRDAQG